MSLKVPFPELSRELQFPTPSASVSGRGITNKGVKCSHCRAQTHTQEQGDTRKHFTYGGTKTECISCTIQTCNEKASWGRDHQQAQGPELLLPSQGCRLKNCAFVPRSLWVQKEEKQSPSLTENRLCEELFTNCCAAFSTRYLPARPAVRAE